MSSDRHLDGEPVRFVSRSRNLRNHQNLEFSRKVEILAILTISGSGHEICQICCPEHFLAKPRIWPQIQVLARGWSEVRPATFQPDPGSDLRSRFWLEVARWTSDLPESAPRCLYIDHFQLPPRWKMTGEEGDPFGGRR